MVGAVGVETAVNLISPADSVHLVSFLTPKYSSKASVLWSRCGQLPEDPLPARAAGSGSSFCGALINLLTTLLCT